MESLLQYSMCREYKEETQNYSKKKITQNFDSAHFFDLRQNFLDPRDPPNLCQSFIHATHRNGLTTAEINLKYFPWK